MVLTQAWGFRLNKCRYASVHCQWTWLKNIWRLKTGKTIIWREYVFQSAFMVKQRKKTLLNVSREENHRFCWIFFMTDWIIHHKQCLLLIWPFCSSWIILETILISTNTFVICKYSLNSFIWTDFSLFFCSQMVSSIHYLKCLTGQPNHILLSAFPD